MAAASTVNSAQHWVEAAIAAGTVKPAVAVTGSRATVNVMISLLAALVSLGLITDGTTA